ncbi:MAG: hypothetical protein ACETVN_04415, partial [Asgard group archaeon]
NFTLRYSVETYGRTIYERGSVGYDKIVFASDYDYYEVVFYNNESTPRNINLLASLERRAERYQNSWLVAPAKLLFFTGWISTIILLVWRVAKTPLERSIDRRNNSTSRSISSRKLVVLVLASCIFWLSFLAMPGYSSLGLENWYTDHARHPYSAYLFTKYGFSVFDTPLGKLASIDNSFYKFVTWTEMPHLYPVGSIFIFLPFGLLLQSGVPCSLVFKMEMALFLIFAHICIYYFTKHFSGKPLRRLVKYAGVYSFCFLLILYSANGMFDAIPLLFSLISLIEFVKNHYSKSVIYATVAAFFKYQAAIVLVPLILIALIRLYKDVDLYDMARKIWLPLTLTLVSVEAYTAYLNIPFMIRARPELIMNAIYLFGPHAQLPWQTRFFAIFSTLALTITIVLYLLRKGGAISSLLLFYTFLPFFSMAYFQPWYFPFFFIYALIPERTSLVNVVVLWLVAISLIISLGYFRYDPLWMGELIRRALVGH